MSSFREGTFLRMRLEQFYRSTLIMMTNGERFLNTGEVVMKKRHKIEWESIGYGNCWFVGLVGRERSGRGIILPIHLAFILCQPPKSQLPMCERQLHLFLDDGNISLQNGIGPIMVVWCMEWDVDDRPLWDSPDLIWAWPALNVSFLPSAQSLDIR